MATPCQAARQVRVYEWAPWLCMVCSALLLQVSGQARTKHTCLLHSRIVGGATPHELSTVCPKSASPCSSRLLVKQCTSSRICEPYGAGLHACLITLPAVVHAAADEVEGPMDRPSHALSAHCSSGPSCWQLWGNSCCSFSSSQQSSQLAQIADQPPASPCRLAAVKQLSR